MTPQDHNKTLGIIYGLLGWLLALAALVELVRVIVTERELERIRSSTELKLLIGVGLILPPTSCPWRTDCSGGGGG
jgi:hypothetical protein